MVDGRRKELDLMHSLRVLKGALIRCETAITRRFGLGEARCSNV
jgi:hypothetical protein